MADIYRGPGHRLLDAMSRRPPWTEVSWKALLAAVAEIDYVHVRPNELLC